MNNRLTPFYKNLALWLLISLVMIFLFNFFNRPQSAREKIQVSYSQFLDLVNEGKVASVTLQGEEIVGKKLDGQDFRTYSPHDPELIKILRDKGVEIVAKPVEDSPWYTNFLISWLPMLLLVGVWIFFMRQMQAGGGKAMSFGKSRARLLSENTVKITFNDVAGIEEVKDEVSEIIEFLKDPKRFSRLGGRIPKGVLLVGPPGTGKTLLARAIAGEAGVPFYSISGSDFVEMFVGVGAARVRDLFLQGKKNSPCIIFIDEIDAVGRHRGAGLGGGHDEREQTLNQLLVEMDGFEANEGVILIAATNRPDVLDPALLRPGRFDRQVVVPIPDLKGREAILKVHTRKTPIADLVDLSVLARGTPGFSGADLENLVNEAALFAARANKDRLTMEDFEHAKDKILMGSERKSMILSDEEKRNTAYHESGHTLVARLLPGTDPIHKVTIIPRGRALGVTQQLPLDEKHTYSKEYLLNTLIVLLGGRAAEELVLKHLTTGAGNDIERATDLARKMVCDWGMSEELGPLTFGKREEQIFLGREISQHRDYSEETARKIDAEIKKLITDCHQRATELLCNNLPKLHALAQALLEKETLGSAEIDEIIHGPTPADRSPEPEDTQDSPVSQSLLVQQA
ncbi:MAG: ATP-dependent zinc metalloprotease FtsH [Deltaproteobacteria bacterium]|nr:ATP-dependent zinc metalloprotease FtsH [Deltaproteobacteria bacterium]MBW1951473.1 ATP-dependent zinc metalloprotease FtsH [Deltaproteobacteria bacterium]MBW1986902.1 ATP-dependent zinc metalloprotease FtsH [Deltaproteobacteria bacterium]MBW2135012.1 ATP-dependent zinc metalloprotease FtsH [Deltaproteobacteria bacterium]